MAIRPIRSEDDLTAALDRIDVLWGAEIGSVEGDEFDVLVDLVEHYESRHHPIPKATPDALLRAHVAENPEKAEDLVRLLGSASLAEDMLVGRSAVPEGARERLAEAWHILPEALTAPAARRSNAA